MIRNNYVKMTVETVARKLVSFLQDANQVILNKYGCEFHKLLGGLETYGVVVYEGKNKYTYNVTMRFGRPMYKNLAMILASDIMAGELKDHSLTKKQNNDNQSLELDLAA